VLALLYSAPLVVTLALGVDAEVVLLSALVGLLVAAPAAARPLTLDEVLRSSATHAPAILDCAPTPDGGVKFKREWFSRRYVGHPDAVAKLCDVRALVVDPASTSGDGDYSSIEHWGWSGVKMRKLHKHRGQWAYNELEAAIVDAMAAYRPSALLVENTSNGRAIVSRLQLRFPNLIPMSHLGKSKAVRWDAQSPVFYAGNVEFPDPQFAPWMLGYVERMVLLTGEVDGELLGVTLPRRLMIPPRPGLAWIIDHDGQRLVQVAARMSP
jgi:phage terminase large subunit-like protein